MINSLDKAAERPKQLWPFCGQSSHKLPLLATISCFLKRTLRVSERKRTVYFSVSYRTAALAAESRLSDSQSSNPGSIPGSATNQSPAQRNVTGRPANQAILPGCCDSSLEIRTRENLCSITIRYSSRFFSSSRAEVRLCKHFGRMVGDHKPKHLRIQLDLLVNGKPGVVPTVRILLSPPRSLNCRNIPPVLSPKYAKDARISRLFRDKLDCRERALSSTGGHFSCFSLDGTCTVRFRQGH